MKRIRLICFAVAVASTTIVFSCSGHRAKDYESSDKVNGSSGAGYQPDSTQKADGPQAAGNTYDTLTDAKATRQSSASSPESANSQ